MVSPLARLNSGVMRPRDAALFYTQPAHQFKYWEKEGVLLKVAHGYYAHIPEAKRGRDWRPEIEALALALGQADYGIHGAVLMHISAARIHGAIPRALAVAVVAIPKRRPALKTNYGRIVFVKRNVETIKRVRIETELATGWCANIEQTALDLANRPNLIAGLSTISQDAARNLFFRSRKEKLNALLEEQRMGTAYTRLRKWTKNA